MFQQPDGLVLGIDEAGRGCVLGDLLLAGVVANKKQSQDLFKIGCNDSKKFGSGVDAFKKRQKLSTQISQICEIFYESAPSTQVDKHVKQTQLNLLERELASRIINNAKFDKVLLDGKNIFAAMADKKGCIQAISKADQKYVAVSAASIIAKHKRDQKLLEFFDSLGEDFYSFKFRGWGYINSYTFEFIKKFYAVYGRLPDNLRKSYQWRSLKFWMDEKNINL